MIEQIIPNLRNYLFLLQAFVVVTILSPLACLGRLFLSRGMIATVQRGLLGLTLTLSISMVATAKDKQFVSLTLCSDRLLMAIAEPSQIAAMSIYSTDAQFMLGEVNTDKPALRPELSALLPYIHATILINETFYPRLVSRLKALGFEVIGINDNPQTPKQLHQLLRQLGKVLGRSETVEQLIEQLPLVSEKSSTALPKVLFLSENGEINTTQPQYRTLMALLGYQNAWEEATVSHWSVEKLLLTNPELLVFIRATAAYSDTSQWLEHPVVKRFASGRKVADLPTKYTYCFDHGVWQGADWINKQLP